MMNSRIVSVILIFLAVCASYIFYNPDTNISSFHEIFHHIKNFVIQFDLGKFFGSKNNRTDEINTLISETLFTASELSLYNGINNGQIYLSILGKVFDVTKGRKYYGVGEDYHGFAARDATRAFITGDFTEKGLVDDISDLSVNELGDLHEWAKKYEKDYTYKGKLIGKFYGHDGSPTKFLKDFEKKLLILADNKKIDNFYKMNYPPCNAEWTPETGSRLWCSRHSGGIKRDWIGFPRKFYQPGSGVSRCACINIKGQETKQKNFEVYENCDPTSISCYLKNN